MARDVKDEFKSFLPELLVYGVLVTAYCLLVLRYLGNWLADLFHHQRVLYGLVALGLIVIQGFVLERLTRILLRLIRRRRREAG